MRVIGNALFSGEPDDVYGFHIRVAWTTDPDQAVRLIRNGARVIIPEEGWQEAAATVLRGLGASESWISRCIWMGTHREELLRSDPSAGIPPA
jgi:hypothetical protein